jgi:protein-L-isoaspartate(D-aspartate) O-methyltransferase
VIALEETAQLVDSMSQRLAAVGVDRAAPVEGPLAKGLPDQAPFDVIYVAGMIETMPDSWAVQVREGGRLVAVMADAGGVGRGKVFTKAGDTLAAREGFDAYPPRFSAFDRKPSFSF